MLNKPITLFLVRAFKEMMSMSFWTFHNAWFKKQNISALKPTKADYIWLQKLLSQVEAHDKFQASLAKLSWKNSFKLII